MGSEYEVLIAIAIKREWWFPNIPKNYFRQDCIDYWNNMIEWAKLEREYRDRQRRRLKGLFSGPLNRPQEPRNPTEET